MDEAVAGALDRLVAEFVARTTERHGRLPRQAHDPDWPSPCQQGAPDASGRILWAPRRRVPAGDYAGLAAALELALPASWLTFFGRYWSDAIPVGGLCGPLELLQVWNDADAERLVANQLGHVLQRRRRRLPATLFFACGDDPDLLYSVDVASGAVLREELGRNRSRTLADDLGTFLEGLAARPGE